MLQFWTKNLVVCEKHVCEITLAPARAIFALVRLITPYLVFFHMPICYCDHSTKPHSIMFCLTSSRWYQHPNRNQYIADYYNTVQRTLLEWTVCSEWCRDLIEFYPNSMCKIARIHLRWKYEGEYFLVNRCEVKWIVKLIVSTLMISLTTTTAPLHISSATSVREITWFPIITLTTLYLTGI